MKYTAYLETNRDDKTVELGSFPTYRAAVSCCKQETPPYWKNANKKDDSYKKYRCYVWNNEMLETDEDGEILGPTEKIEVYSTAWFVYD